MKVKCNYRSYSEFANLNDIRNCLASQKVASKHCECASPYLYEPFFKLMLEVPYKWKKDRQIYRAWLEQKCPCDYPSTFRLGAKTKVGHFVRRGIHHLVVRMSGKTKYDMNPYQTWGKQNPELVEHMKTTFAEDMGILDGKVDAKHLVFLSKMWNQGNMLEKLSQ